MLERIKMAIISMITWCLLLVAVFLLGFFCGRDFQEVKTQLQNEEKRIFTEEEVDQIIEEQPLPKKLKESIFVQQIPVLRTDVCMEALQYTESGGEKNPNQAKGDYRNGKPMSLGAFQLGRAAWTEGTRARPCARRSSL